MAAALAMPEAPLLPGCQFANALPAVSTTLKSELWEGDPTEIIRRLAAQLETEILQPLVQARTRERFDELREELFPRYAKLSTAIASIVSAMVRESRFKALIQYSFQAMETALNTADLLDDLPGGRDEALFCLATLRRTYRLLPNLRMSAVSRELRRDDAKLSQDFCSFALWTHLHLDCLGFAIASKLSPTPQTLHEMLVGFRVAVMAYSTVRQALELRRDAQSEDVGLPSLGESAEERQLAEESTETRESTLGDW
jgi:hypothetical protein